MAAIMRHVVTVLGAAAFALFPLSSCATMRRALARGDSSAATFVAATTVLLAALLATVRAHERADAAARRRRGLQLKAAAWALSSALTGMFAYRVAAVAPAPHFAVLVWTMAGATVVGGFCFLFVDGEASGGVEDTAAVGGRRQEP